jgi:hypothetical protein
MWFFDSELLSSLIFSQVKVIFYNAGVRCSHPELLLPAQSCEGPPMSPTCLAVVIAVLASLVGGSGAARAANLDLCNDVLRKDIFNHTSGSSASSASAKSVYLNSFFENSAVV